MKKLWESHTPEELAEREKPKKQAVSNILASQWMNEWSIKFRQIKGSNRDEVSVHYGGKQKKAS